MPQIGLLEGKLLAIDTVPQNRLNTINNHEFCGKFKKKMVLGP